MHSLYFFNIIVGGMPKAKIFVDFWNFQLSVIGVMGNQYRMDWTKLSPWLMQAARSIVDADISFEGMQVYMSYYRNRPDDQRLRDWASNFLDRVPGVDVLMVS